MSSPPNVSRDRGMIAHGSNRQHAGRNESRPAYLRLEPIFDHAQKRRFANDAN